MNIKELMDELAAGEAARNRIPELESSLHNITTQLDKALSHNQQLELRGRDREDQISGLLARIRSLEVERDDAAFRELEATDKLSTLLKAVRHATADLDGSAMQVDPPKAPVPAPAPEPVKASEAPNTGVVGNALSAGATETQQAANTTDVGSVGGSQGQSEPHPTAGAEVQGNAGVQNATDQAGANTGQASAPMADTSPAVDTRPWWEKDAEEREKNRIRDSYNESNR